MDASTTLRLPQTVPQALKIQEQNNKTKQNGKPKQKTRPPYNLDMEKAAKTRQSGTEMRTMGKRKWKSIFI